MSKCNPPTEDFSNTSVKKPGTSLGASEFKGYSGTARKRKNSHGLANYGRYRCLRGIDHLDDLIAQSKSETSTVRMPARAGSTFTHGWGMKTVLWETPPSSDPTRSGRSLGAVVPAASAPDDEARCPVISDPI